MALRCHVKKNTVLATQGTPRISWIIDEPSQEEARGPGSGGGRCICQHHIPPACLSVCHLMVTPPRSERASILLCLCSEWISIWGSWGESRGWAEPEWPPGASISKGTALLMVSDHTGTRCHRQGAVHRENVPLSRSSRNLGHVTAPGRPGEGSGVRWERALQYEDLRVCRTQRSHPSSGGELLPP